MSQVGLTYLDRLKTTPCGPGQTRVACTGNGEVLNKERTSVFCSGRCPASLILATHDLARTWATDGRTVISGFHSAAEKECLTMLLRGKAPIIICPARSIERMRIPSGWRRPLDEGRLLLLSPFEPKHHRPTVELAQRRNEFVAALGDEVFVAHATPGGKIEHLCRKIVSWRKPLLTFDHPENANLLALGANPIKT